MRGLLRVWDFTMNFLSQIGTREKIRENLEEERKKVLRQKLEEVKRKKEELIYKLAENQKEMIEREKFIEKMRKIANDAAIKIQRNWRRILVKQKTLRGIVRARIVEQKYRVLKSATEKLSAFSSMLLKHQQKIEQVDIRKMGLKY